MKDLAASRLLGTYVLMAVSAVTLLVTPFNSLDPVSIPKLSLLIFVGFISIGLVSRTLYSTDKRKYRTAALLVFVFIAHMTLVLLVDNRNFALKFYGTSGRNTGYIAYVSLAFILLASVIAANRELTGKFVKVLCTMGFLVAGYGIAQSLGHNFYSFNYEYASKVFSTFGNANFHSAFMGIVAATALTLAVFSSLKLYLRLALLTLVILAIYNVSISSQQGYLNFIAGSFAALVIYLFQKKYTALGWATLIAFGLGVISVLLGILDKGPLAEAIYKSSLQARGFYWRGALNIITHHPFFGVGMDGFGDWYRRSRSLEVAQFNPGIVANTAHNIPLDIGSSGGFPLLLLYLAIIGLAFISILRVVKRQSEFDVYFAAMVAAWVAYQAQSLISINQLGLGVWGWSLTGLLIGYEINTRDDNQIVKVKITGSTKFVSEKVSAGVLVITFVTSGIGLAIALPPYIAANKFYQALQSGDANIIQPAAFLHPYDLNRFLYVAQILHANKLEAQAIQVLREASKIYPDSFDIWSQWASLQEATQADIAHAKSEMKRLDPYNPDLN